MVSFLAILYKAAIHSLNIYRKLCCHDLLYKTIKGMLKKSSVDFVLFHSNEC